jgi:hypothetical protein
VLGQLSLRAGWGMEMGENHQFHDAHNTSVTVVGVVSAQETHGEGGGSGEEKLENKRKKEDKYKQGGSKGKEKGKSVGNRKRPMSESVGTVRNQRQREGMAGAGIGGGPVKKDSVDCPHNRDRRSCWQREGASIFEHNRILRQWNQYIGPGLSICEHSLIRSVCKLCKTASICEHNRERSWCKQCNGSSICEHKRQRRTCKPRASHVAGQASDDQVM